MRNKGITITSKNVGPIFRRAVKALRKADKLYREQQKLDFPKPCTWSKKAGEKVIEIVKKNRKKNLFISWPISVQYKVFYGGKITMRDLKNMV